MTRLLLLALALVAAQDARAAGRIGGAPASGGFTAGQDVTGDDGVFKTLQSTGTAPSLTATGAVFTGSGSFVGSNGLFVGGNLGIGTASPGSKLEVSAGSVAVTGVGARLGVGIRGLSAGRTLQASDYILLGNPAEGNSRAAIRFGQAGYDAPSSPDAESIGDKVVIWNSATDKTAIGMDNQTALWFESVGRDTSGFIWYSSPDTTVRERMRLNGNGNLGLGTASPCSTCTAHIAGNISVTNFFQPGSRSTLQLSLLAPTAVGQYIDNLTISMLCRSTGTSAGNWAKMTDGTGCF